MPHSDLRSTKPRDGGSNPSGRALTRRTSVRKSKAQRTAESALLDAVREEAWAQAKGAEAERIAATLKRETANQRLVRAHMAEMGTVVSA